MWLYPKWDSSNYSQEKDTPFGMMLRQLITELVETSE